jgi:hypothetical protein
MPYPRWCLTQYFNEGTQDVPKCPILAGFCDRTRVSGLSHRYLSALLGRDHTRLTDGTRVPS